MVVPTMNRTVGLCCISFPQDVSYDKAGTDSSVCIPLRRRTDGWASFAFVSHYGTTNLSLSCFLPLLIYRSHAVPVMICGLTRRSIDRSNPCPPSLSKRGMHTGTYIAQLVTVFHGQPPIAIVPLGTTCSVGILLPLRSLHTLSVELLLILGRVRHILPTRKM